MQLGELGLAGFLHLVRAVHLGHFELSLLVVEMNGIPTVKWSSAVVKDRLQGEKDE